MKHTDLATSLQHDHIRRYLFPYPLASLYRQMRASHQPADRFGHTLLLAEGLFRFLALVNLADVLSHADSTKDAKQIKKWLAMLHNSGMGKFLGLTRSAVEWSKEHSLTPFLQETQPLFDDDTWTQASNAVVELRNNTTHILGHISNEEAKPLLEQSEPLLETLLTHCHFLKNYQLGRAVDLQWQVTDNCFSFQWYGYQGFDDRAEPISLQSQKPTDGSQILLLHAERDQALYLGPCFRWAVFPKLNPHAHLYWLYEWNTSKDEIHYWLSEQREVSSVSMSVNECLWHGCTEMQLTEESKSQLTQPLSMIPTPKINPNREKQKNRADEALKQAEEHREKRQYQQAQLFYERAIATYEMLIEEDESAKPQLAKASRGQGIVQGNLGALDNAIASLEAARTFYAELQSSNKDVYQIALADILGVLAETHRIAGRISEATSLITKALHFVDAFDDKDNVELRVCLARFRRFEGSVHWGAGRLKQALEAEQQAMDLYMQLIQQEGRNELRPNLARCTMNQAITLADQGKLPEAYEGYQRAIDLYTQLIQQEAQNELRPSLAHCIMNQAITLKSQGKLSDAEEGYQQAIDLYTQLIQQEGQLELRPNLARCTMNRAITLKNQGKLSEAEEGYQRAIGLYTQLIQQEGRNELRPDLACCNMNLAVTLDNQDKLSEAGEGYQRAIDLYTQLIQQEGRNELRPDLARCLMNQASTLADQGKSSEAEESYQRAIDLYTQLIQQEGRNELIGMLAWTQTNAANTLRQLKRNEEAQALLDEAIPVLKAEIERTGHANLQKVLEFARWIQKQLNDSP